MLWGGKPVLNKNKLQRSCGKWISKKRLLWCWIFSQFEPYLSPSKVINKELTFHKHDPSSKDYVDKGSLDTSVHNVEPSSNEVNLDAFKSRGKIKTLIKRIANQVTTHQTVRFKGPTTPIKG